MRKRILRLIGKQGVSVDLLKIPDFGFLFRIGEEFNFQICD